MFTRRTATVTMSAPDASCACAMTACEEYLPVPTMSRERNVLSAMVKAVSVIAAWCFVPSYPLCPACLSAAHEVDDLQPIAFAHHRVGKSVVLDDREVVLDGHTPGIDLQRHEEIGDRQRPLELERFSVERDLHGRERGDRSAY